MNIKVLAPLGVAAVFAAGAAFVAKNMITTQPQQSANPDSMLRQVVVANTNILPGTEINSSMLITAKVSQEMAPEDTFTEPNDLAGRVTQGPIYKGQPVMATLLAPKGSPGGMGALVPKGMRAITIQIDEFSGVGGFLVPGCRVDILSTLQGDTNGDMAAHTIVQNVLVTAIGQRMTLQKEPGGQEAPIRSVTLMATPEEAKAIELAASTGRPRLVLRNFRDESEAATAGVSLKDIKSGEGHKHNSGFDPFAWMGGGPRLTTTPVESDPFSPVSAGPSTQPSTQDPRFWSIKVIRGGQESEVQLPLENNQTPVVPSTTSKNEPVTKSENTPIGGHE